MLCDFALFGVLFTVVTFSVMYLIVFNIYIFQMNKSILSYESV